MYGFGFVDMATRLARARYANVGMPEASVLDQPTFDRADCIPKQITPISFEYYQIIDRISAGKKP